jgi:DNA-directed RNA polymerase sigma subunit (sigma70/sigma32)
MTTPKESGWREEVAQRIQDVYFEKGARVNRATWDITLALLRTHEATAIAQERARLPEEVVKLKRIHDETTVSVETACMADGYNAALADVLALLHAPEPPHN